MRKKLFALLSALAFMFCLSACDKNAEAIVLQSIEEIASISVVSEGITATCTDKEWIGETMSILMDMKSTSKASVNDSPSVDNYVSIHFNGSDNTVKTVYFYEEKGKQYVEQPYQGIYIPAPALGTKIADLLDKQAGVDMPAPGGMGSSQRIAPVIQEDVTAVTITHRVGGTEMVSVATGDDLNALRTWAAGLRYEHKTFPAKQSPGDAEGNEVYSLVLTGGEYPDFDYIISGADSYLLMQGEWYLVSNPSAPPYDKKAESPAASYHFTRYGKESEVISIAALTDEELAERIIMDVTAKSAAWQGVDVATLTEYYLIEQTSATGEKSEYYAYLLDGKAVLQRGSNGLYSYLSQELYDELDGIYTEAVERTEP